MGEILVQRDVDLQAVIRITFGDEFFQAIVDPKSGTPKLVDAHDGARKLKVLDALLLAATRSLSPFSIRANSRASSLYCPSAACLPLSLAR